MKALLVIDMQNVCVGSEQDKFFRYDSAALTDSVNSVIRQNAGSLVVYIRSLMKRNFMSRFAPVRVYGGTKGAELADTLEVVSEHVFDKYSEDAFTNPELDVFLRKNRVDEVEVIGVDGGGCVALTALGALNKGYRVVLNTGAIGTMFEKNRDKYFKKLKNRGAVFV